MSDFRPEQVSRIARAMRDVQAARAGRDYTRDAENPEARRAVARLDGALRNSTHAERGAAASDLNDRLERARQARPPRTPRSTR